jgi:hypothetical protein
MDAKNDQLRHLYRIVCLYDKCFYDFVVFINNSLKASVSSSKGSGCGYNRDMTLVSFYSDGSLVCSKEKVFPKSDHWPVR